MLHYYRKPPRSILQMVIYSIEPGVCMISNATPRLQCFGLCIICIWCSYRHYLLYYLTQDISFDDANGDWCLQNVDETAYHFALANNDYGDYDDDDNSNGLGYDQQKICDVHINTKTKLIHYNSIPMYIYIIIYIYISYYKGNAILYTFFKTRFSQIIINHAT